MLVFSEEIQERFQCSKLSVSDGDSGRDVRALCLSKEIHVRFQGGNLSVSVGNVSLIQVTIYLSPVLGNTAETRLATCLFACRSLHSIFTKQAGWQ